MVREGNGAGRRGGAGEGAARARVWCGTEETNGNGAGMRNEKNRARRGGGFE